MKKIIILTATRADFGKMKSLIYSLRKNKKKYKVTILITGMHMIPKFGNTYKEILKYFRTGVIMFRNQKFSDPLEIILANTISKLSRIFEKINPDLVITHGDRVETLATAITGSLNHYLVGHIEGGELSGTIDDTIRHSVTKLSHIHFVSNNKAKKRVINLGEIPKNVYNIGSSDLDSVKIKNLPNLNLVKKRYNIKFKNYSILIWHPVTSEIKNLSQDTQKLINFLKNQNEKFIVIYPNNDPGSEEILKIYKKNKNKNFKIFPSLRFNYFITLLKNAKYIIGNSSCAIYEAPYFKIPSINIGTRQKKRFQSRSIFNLSIEDLDKNKINRFLENYKPLTNNIFGKGDSYKKFLRILNKKKFWKINSQKTFNE
tara:strand:+ start:776 stop:1891 length:1116 start_codon:yes stop_codon:yes gene_type:complete